MIISKNFIRHYAAIVSLAFASACAVVSCVPDSARAQIVNPAQPATGVPIAGTGITVSGQTVSINYGLGSQTYTGNFNVGGTLTAGSFAPTSISTGALTATGTVSGAGFSNLFAAAYPIGSTTPNTGAFTNLAASGTTTLATVNNSGTVTNSGATVLTGTVSGAGIASYEANINHVQTVLNVAALRALSCVSGSIYATQGNTTLADGGNATYVCNGADTTTPDNGCNIIAAANTFRYYLQYQQGLNVRVCGVKGNGVTDDTAQTQAAINYAMANFNTGSNWGYRGTEMLYFPPGYYIYSSALQITGPIAMTGEGSAEFSSRTRLVQTSANTDLFTFVAVNGNSSFDIEDMTLLSTATGTGNLVNVQLPRPASGSPGWNSWKIRHCVFANPQNASIRATGDDIEISNDVFDVGTNGGPSVQLGTVAIGNPTVATGVGSTTGGTLPAANYFVKIVGVDQDGRQTNVGPESTVVTTTGATSSIAYTWAALSGAASYQVWFSNTTGTEAQYFPSKTNSFTLTTTAGATSGTIPSSNFSINGTATDVRIQSDNFFNISSHVILAYDTYNVTVSNNIVSQPNGSTTTFAFFDSFDAVAIQNQNMVINNNALYGVRRIVGLNAAKQVAINANTCYNCGIGTSETVDAIILGGATNDIAISGNAVQGGYGARGAVAAGGASGGPITVASNTFDNTAPTGTPIAVNLNTASGTVSGNNITGWTTPVFATDLYAVGYAPNTLVVLPYSASILTDASLGNNFFITANNSTAFTINAPTNPSNGQVITYKIANTSGGSLGAITWNAAFHMAAFTSPATTFNTSISFIYQTSAGYWREVYQGSAAIPN